jgi:hypothetical protein
MRVSAVLAKVVIRMPAFIESAETISSEPWYNALQFYKKIAHSARIVAYDCQSVSQTLWPK